MFVSAPAGVGFAGRDGVGRAAPPVAQRVQRGGLLLFLHRDGKVARLWCAGQNTEVSHDADGCNTSSQVLILPTGSIFTFVMSTVQ